MESWSVGTGFAWPVTDDDLTGSLQRAVSCVTPAVLRSRATGPGDERYVVSFSPSAEPIVLGQDRRQILIVRHFYRLSSLAGRRRGSSHAVTVGYVVDLLDDGGALVVGYHWHPIDDGAVVYSHLHIGRQFAHTGLPRDIRVMADRLVRSHLPTGPILLPTVLRLAIAEFGIEPLRRDWAAVLDESETALRASLTAPA